MMFSLLEFPASVSPSASSASAAVAVTKLRVACLWQALPVCVCARVVLVCNSSRRQMRRSWCELWCIIVKSCWLLVSPCLSASVCLSVSVYIYMCERVYARMQSVRLQHNHSK